MLSRKTTMNDQPDKPGKWRNDEGSTLVVHQGASLAQLAALFEMNQRDIKSKIAGAVQPCGERRGHPIYKIKDVAPYIVNPPYDIDEFIQRMTVADLPHVLRKEFWAGMRSRQLFEKEDAELWPTAEVVDTISSLLKTVRMSMLISREAVERETELTPRQRAIITRIIDNSLEEAHAAVTKQFKRVKANAKSTHTHTEREIDTEDL